MLVTIYNGGHYGLITSKKPIRSISKWDDIQKKQRLNIGKQN